MKRITLNPVQYEAVKGYEAGRKVGSTPLSPTQYQDIGGVLDPIIVRDFKGVNGYDPLSIADNFLTDMKNMTSDDYPALSVRPGYTVLGSAIGSKVLGLGSWKDRELHAVFSDGTWRKWNGSSWTTLLSGLNTSADCYFTNYQGNLSDINLFMTNGVDTMRRYDGSSISAISGAPAGANFITTFQNRLWVGVGKELHACALDQPDQWSLFNGNDEDSYARDMESTAGEDINMLSGSLTKLTIGMPNSVHELYGGVPSDFSTRLVTEDGGFSNNKSAATQSGLMRFMNKFGIYEFAGGTIPDKSFSEIIRKYLSNINTDSCSGSDGERLYFFVPPNTLLMYDPRPGIEAWNVWQDIRSTCFLEMNNDLYIGTSDGRVLRLGGTNDGGNAISWYAITKPFTAGSIAQKTRWIKMYTFWELAAGSTLSIYLSPSVEGNDWELVQTITGTGNQIQRIMIPIDNKYALANMLRIKFEGSGWARMHEYTRQVRQLPLY